MKNILIIGAGRSSSSLIKYLLDNSSLHNWKLTIGDISLDSAKQKLNGHENGCAVLFDINNEEQRTREISAADIVISLLPAHMHLPVATECVRQKKHFVNASYVSKEMQQLDNDAKKSGVILLNECGLDPGIDHMSAMKIIDEVKEQGGTITSFKSYTGGLVAPESNDNPWGYKFSWNPRNVILAGQGTATYIENNKYKYIPYSRLFSQTEIIEVKGLGTFDGYANRDSLSYRTIYALENIPTMLRGTLRQKGFCKAWNVFVQLGLTDDSYVIEDSEHLTYLQLTKAFLPDDTDIATFINEIEKGKTKNENSEVMKMIECTGILDDKQCGLVKATPAQILQSLLEEKWKLKEDDKDMIVMQHQFGIRNQESGIKNITSSLVVAGDNSVYTAMAKTVGLPIAIATKLILTDKIKLRGVQIPVSKEIYKPVLNELKESGINFSEEEN